MSNASQQTFGASYSAKALPVIEISALSYKNNEIFDYACIIKDLYVFEEYFEIDSKDCKMIYKLMLLFFKQYHFGFKQYL